FGVIAPCIFPPVFNLFAILVKLAISWIATTNRAVLRISGEHVRHSRAAITTILPIQRSIAPFLLLTRDEWHLRWHDACLLIMLPRIHQPAIIFGHSGLKSIRHPVGMRDHGALFDVHHI